MTDGMDEGYVKLWRKSIESEVFKNADLWMFWCWCLMKATHKPYTSLVGYQRIDLQPGQFIFGRKKAAEVLPLSQHQIRTCLETLINLQNVASKPTNKYTIITICNWELYQIQENENGQQSGQQTANKRPTNGHIQEHKEHKEVKEDIGADTPLPKLFEKYESEYTAEELTHKIAFLEYWMEKNEGGKKERWKMEKVFDIKKRFRTWLKNESKWKRGSKQIEVFHNEPVTEYGGFIDGKKV